MIGRVPLPNEWVTVHRRETMVDPWDDVELAPQVGRYHVALVSPAPSGVLDGGTRSAVVWVVLFDEDADVRIVDTVRFESDQRICRVRDVFVRESVDTPIGHLRVEVVDVDGQV